MDQKDTIVVGEGDEGVTPPSPKGGLFEVTPPSPKGELFEDYIYLQRMLRLILVGIIY